MARETGATEPEDGGRGSPGGGLGRLLAGLHPAPKGPPPVERWDPPFCGDIDMRIAADGQWFYQGTPIGRPALVRLFASVLKREDNRFCLVTPVEKVGITVEDAPFQAVEMAIDGEGDTRQLAFRTNVDDVVTVGPEHRLTFLRDAGGAVKPYLHVRRGLSARVTRALTYDLLALGDIRSDGGRDMFGVMAGCLFHPVMPAAEIEGLA